MRPAKSQKERPARAGIVVPTLNEAPWIAETLQQLSAGAPPGTPIFLVDGGSDDRTPEIARGLADKIPSLIVVHNPARRQSAGVNQGAHLAQAAGCSVLIRADAHACYPDNYVTRLIETLDRTGADSVVVPLIAKGYGGFSDAAADVQTCWMGHGGADHRRLGPAKFVDHGHHAAFRLTMFQTLGGYDPLFFANEDAEFDHRATVAGYNIFLETALAIRYHPRASAHDLWRQYHRNGRGRMMTTRKHKLALRMRQWLPLLLPYAMVASGVFALLISPLFWIVPIGYLATLTLGAFHHARRRSVRHIGQMVIAAIAMHFGFGIGATRQWFERRAMRAWRHVADLKKA